MANESSVLVRLRLLGANSFAREATTAGRGLGAIEKRGTALSRGLGGVNKALGVAAAAVKGLGVGAGVAAGTGIAYAVKSGANFEQSMANVQARLLTSRATMEQLSGQALQLGADTQFSAQQAADAMGEFAAAGFNAQQIMAIMPGTLNLAAAAGTDLAFAAETSGAIIRQFGLGARDAGHVADVLTLAVNKSAIGLDDMALSMKYVGPVAGRFNQSLEDMSAAVAILGNVGIKGETAGTTLRAALVRLIRPTQRTQKVLSDMGITTRDFARITTDAHGKLRPMPDILGRLSDSFKGLTGPQKRKALAQLFGTEALPGMVTLMGMGKKRIDAMSASLDNSRGAAKRTAGIMRNTVKGAWDNFTGSIETAAIKLERRFQPAIRNALNVAADQVNKVTKQVPGIVSAFGQGARGGLQTPFSGIQGAAQDVGKFMRQGFGVAKQAALDLWDALKPAQPFLQNVLLPLLKGIAIGVIGSVVAAFKVAIPIIKLLATALGFVGNVMRPFRGVIQGIGTVIGFVAAGPILKLLGGLRYLGVAFRVLGVPLRIANAGFRLVTGVIGRVIGIVVRANTWVGRMAGTFGGAGRKIVLSVTNFVGGVISKIEGLIGKIRGLGGRFLSAGKGLIQKLFGGIRSAFSGAAGAMAGLGRMLADWLNVHTPLGDQVKAGPIKFRLPALASGGTVTRGGLAIVGERGPELAALPTGSRVYSAGETRRASAAMAAPAPILLTANLHLDGKQIHSETFRVNRQMAEAR